MRFGSYEELCSSAAMPVCSLLRDEYGLFPDCTPRALVIGNFYIFDTATFMLYIFTMIMTGSMIYSVRGKQCAIGKREINLFLYLFFTYTLLESFTVSNLIPTTSFAYTLIVGCHFALAVTLAWTLFSIAVINFLTMFPIMSFLSPKEETTDETTTNAISTWAIRGLSFGVFFGALVIALATFTNKSGLEKKAPTALFVFQFILIPVMLALYFILRVLYLKIQCNAKWSIGDLGFAAGSFLASQGVLIYYSKDICSGSKHYLDGTFFSEILLLLSVMMLYKSWDSSNHDDFEFEVDETIPIFATHKTNPQRILVETLHSEKSDGIPLPAIHLDTIQSGTSLEKLNYFSSMNSWHDLQITSHLDHTGFVGQSDLERDLYVDRPNVTKSFLTIEMPDDDDPTTPTTTQ